MAYDWLVLSLLPLCVHACSALIPMYLLSLSAWDGGRRVKTLNDKVMGTVQKWKFLNYTSQM